jgi:hypothetical protein
LAPWGEHVHDQIVDLFDDGAMWNIGVVVFLIMAIAVRAGGVRGPRAAAAADEPAPRAP